MRNSTARNRDCARLRSRTGVEYTRLFSGRHLRFQILPAFIGSTAATILNLINFENGSNAQDLVYGRLQEPTPTVTATVTM